MTYVDRAVVASNLAGGVTRLSRFTREPFHTLVPRPSDWLVKDLLPSSGICFIVGPSQSRKSFLALEWSMRIALGHEILGRRTKQAGVVFVAAEGQSGVRKRVAAWRKLHGIASAPFDMIAQAPDLRNPVQIEDLIAILKEATQDHAANGERLGLVVIDTLAASMPGGDENSGADMSALLANVQRIETEIGALVVIVSHTGKDESRGLRGWSGQFAGADTVIMLTRDTDSGQSVGTVCKQKDGEDGFRFAFSLARVALGFDEDGDEIGSCVVTYEEAPDPKSKARRPRALSAPAQLVLNAVKHVTDNGQIHPAPQLPGVEDWMRAVTRDDVRARAMASGLAGDEDKPAAIRQRFGRALEDIVAAKAVRVEGGLIWLLS